MPTETTTTGTTLPTGTWTVDPVHSNVEFSVKHVGIATVKGRFNDFAGTIAVGAEGASARGAVEVGSVDTGESQRDNHLRSADFFEVEKFPKLEFVTTSIERDGEDLTVKGEITIHGVKKPITLTGEVEGADIDHEGKQRLGLSLSATVSRADFGMRFNAALGSGNLVVSDKVKIQIDVSAVKND